jgi:hypothetical protein
MQFSIKVLMIRHRLNMSKNKDLNSLKNSNPKTLFLCLSSSKGFLEVNLAHHNYLNHSKQT